MTHPTRRQLLGRVLACSALGVGAASGGYYLSRDRITLGLIGAGIRGQELARILRLCSWYYWRYGVITAVCDVDRPRAESIRDTWCPGASIFVDYHELLQKSDIDAVLVATPDHWHVPIAKAALETRKAVYLEKPISLAVHEGRELIALAKKVQLPVLVGTQQRSNTFFRTACELVRNNYLGSVQRAEVTVPLKQQDEWTTLLEATPAGLDWDRWLGPAPAAQFHWARFKGWRSWWDYGGGEIANMGAHHIDIAHWALGLELSGPLHVAGKADPVPKPDDPRVPARFTVEMKYRDDLVVTIRSDSQQGTGGGGIRFHGEKSSLYVDRSRIEGHAYDMLEKQSLSKGKLLHPSSTNTPRDTRQHLCHFLDCVRLQIQPVSDIESGHRTATACHLANLSLRLNRPIQWNPVSEMIVNDVEAASFLHRKLREGWVS